MLSGLDWVNLQWAHQDVSASLVKEHWDYPNSISNGLILQVGKQSEISGGISKIQVGKKGTDVFCLFGREQICKLPETPLCFLPLAE